MKRKIGIGVGIAVAILCIYTCMTPKISVAGIPVVGMVAEGDPGDRSFASLASRGLDELNTTVPLRSVFKKSNKTEALTTFEGVSDANPAIVWGIGYIFEEAIIQIANVNPHLRYALIDIIYNPKDPKIEIPPNLQTFAYKTEQGSFLAGVVAARTTKTNKVGFIGGFSGDVVESFRVGFEAGLKYINPKISYDWKYTGSWIDIAMGAGYARNMYNEGADIIMLATGVAGLGAISVAQSLGPEYMVIGVDLDQADLAPKNTLTSVLKLMDKTIAHHTEIAIKDPSIRGGTYKMLGIEDDAIGIVKDPKFISAEILDEVEMLETLIREGTLEIPRNQAQLDAFLKELKDDN